MSILPGCKKVGEKELGNWFMCNQVEEGECHQGKGEEEGVGVGR
jgi:hypothetical protein